MAAVRDGWFFPGLRGAPTVIVCHGYRAQRADVLTLVTALQEQQFNVFLFDFTGHGQARESPPWVIRKLPSFDRRFKPFRRATMWTRRISGSGESIWEDTRRWKLPVRSVALPRLR